MNRWFGSKQDSDQQASERSRRAARRTIADLNLILSEEEEDFQDCDTSFNKSNIFLLDGAGDDLEESEIATDSPDIMTDAAALLAAEKRKPVEDANFPDDDDAWKKELKIKFDQQDVEY